ncbi:MAG: SCO1664 family protein [Ilumatobacteraceae bacterium]|nr:SCO1664 family protein [Ilumatobacteraceae bacterium]
MQCSSDNITEALTHGDIDIVGRMPDSSNATFLVTIAHGDVNMQAIYKPLRGERPLWDFEPGLHRREVAAFLLSEALGLGLVPITILRDGPFGEGSVQFFVESDTREHYFSLFEERPELHDRLREFAIFDFVANNTDRKSGHCLLGIDGNVWGIDHGVCFSADFKLRTVIWEFGGEPIPQYLLTAIAPMATTVPLHIAALLSDDEVHALQERVQWLLDHPEFPVDNSGRRYPWPIV